MRAHVGAVCVVAALALQPELLLAQEPPPIARFVVDLRGTFPGFPTDDPQLAESRGLTAAELPGRGLGIDLAAHVNIYRRRGFALGLGGHLTLARATRTPPSVPGEPALPVVVTRFGSLGSQLSFNFGTGDGWSYISGGIGQSIWSIIPRGAHSLPPDDERLRTFNYGGGARWFAKPHLAFTFDVRIHAIDPGQPHATGPGSPRTPLLVIGAGVSVK
jgi:hypothetical protein